MQRVMKEKGNERRYSEFTVITIESGPISTNCYLVFSTTHAFLVDAPFGSFDHVHALLQEEKLSLTHVFLTHSHWDHIGDLKKICEHYTAAVYVHTSDAYNIEKPGSDGIPTFENPEAILLDSARGDQKLLNQKILRLIDQDWMILPTPGHTPGGLCLFHSKEKVLFSGDTLFKGAYGNISRTTGNSKHMIESLKKLAQLPAETIVFPGHGPSTTIAQETWLDRMKTRYTQT